MPSQLKNAVPLLDRLGIKATFYVNLGYSIDWAGHASTWRQLTADGHEVGNHTDRHPGPCEDFFRPRGHPNYCLENLDGDEIARAIDDPELELLTLTGLPSSARTFAHPCVATCWGAGASRTSYVPLVASRYVAALAGYIDGVTNDPSTIDLWHVSSYTVDDATADEAIAYIETPLRRGHWAVLMIHGIGEEWNVVNLPDFERILKYVADRQDRLRVAPLVAVAKYVRDRPQVSSSPFRSLSEN